MIFNFWFLRQFQTAITQLEHSKRQNIQPTETFSNVSKKLPDSTSVTGYSEILKSNSWNNFELTVSVSNK